MTFPPSLIRPHSSWIWSDLDLSDIDMQWAAGHGPLDLSQLFADMDLVRLGDALQSLMKKIMKWL